MSSSNEIIPNHVKEAAKAVFAKAKDKAGAVGAEAIRMVISDTYTEYELWGNFIAGDVSLSCVARRSHYSLRGLLGFFHVKEAEPVEILDIEAGIAEKTYVYGKFNVRRIPSFFIDYSRLKRVVESFADGMESYEIETGAAGKTHIVWGKFSLESLGFLGKPVHVKEAAERMIAKGKQISEADDGGMLVENSDAGAVVALERSRAASLGYVRSIFLEAAIGKSGKEISEADVIGDYDTEAGLFPEKLCWGEGLDPELDCFDIKKPVWTVCGKIRVSKPERFCISKLADMSIAIAGQGILTLTGNAASTGSEHTGEFKIIALANGFGFTSTLISMIYKNKYSALLGKLGVICASFGLIGSMAVLLDVGKGWMWGITGVLTLIPAIAVSLA